VAVCDAGVQAVRTGQKVAVQLRPRPGADDSVVELTGGITAPDLEAARP
jgi:myo-inositol 2-dehydrogenase/D-chiro-inositol 1-dehydrogenase